MAVAPPSLEEGPGSTAPGLAGLERTVHGSAIFHECSYEFVEAILLQIRKILLHPGKVLVKEDENGPRSMYFVLFGNLDVYRLDQKIGTISSGQVMGEGVLLGILESWSYTVVARDSCMLAEMTSQTFAEVLQDHPEESEYFEALLDYFSIRKEEMEENESDLRESLRRMPCLRQVSEEFLQAIEKGLVHHLYFAEQCVLTEGQDSSYAAFLNDGEVVVEAAKRAVRREEVPFVEMHFTMSPEGETRASTATEEDVPRSTTSYRRASRARGKSLATSAESSRRPSGDDVAVESLISMTNKARAEAMIAEAVSDGLTPGYDINVLPEGAPFGEECLLGISPSSTTIRVCKLSVVLLLHRAVFQHLLQDFPDDAQALSRFCPEMLPKPNFQDLPICQHVDMSPELLDFFSRHVERRIFFPGDHIEPDNVQTFLPKQLLNPALNVTYAVVSLGHVRVKTPPGLELAPFGHLSSGDILGPGSILPGSWFWSSVKVQALQICFVTVLHRGVIARGLEEMPREREKVLPLLVRENTGNPNVAQQVRSSERVAKILRERSIFADTSQDFLAEILNYGTVRVFMPGDRILQQGAEGNSMFILSLGLAQVVKENLEEVDNGVVRNLYFIGGLTFGSVFGELVMLGVQSKRTASIVASSTCCTWEVEQDRILGILNRHPVERTNFLKLVEEHLDKLAAPRVIHHKLFSDFSAQFRTLIGVNCERRLYFPRETIVREGTTGDRMYIMNLGSASVKVTKHNVMQIRGGSHFGFNMICSDKERYSMTITTDTMCQVLIITRSSYQHALTKYPEMKEVAQHLEATERARERKQFAGFMKLVHRRRGLRYLLEAMRDGILSEAKTSSQMNDGNKSTLQTVIKGWKQEVAKSAELRQGDEQLRQFNDAQIYNWLQKRKLRIEQVKPDRELSKWTIDTLSNRGPARPKPKLEALPSATAAAAARMQEIRDWSPYMQPAPVWRRRPQSPRSNSRGRRGREEASPRLPPVKK